MYQLRPGETFPITRQLEDPADSTTYYVRAVIRWADSDEIIQVNGLNYLNLTDQTDQRFKGNFHVPADGTGLGRPLTITTKVYTDSGYTTLSNTYGIKETVYLVMDRRNPYSGMGGGGSNIDYQTLRKIIKEELKNRPKLDMGGPIVDLDPILNNLRLLQTSIEAINIPEAKEVDLSPIREDIRGAILSINSKINDIKIPEYRDQDLSPIIDKSEADFTPEQYHAKMEDLFNRVKEYLDRDIEDIKEKFGQITKMIKKIDMIIPKKLSDVEDSDDEDE